MTKMINTLVSFTESPIRPSHVYIWSLLTTKTAAYTVKPVLSGHSRERTKVAV